MQRTICRPSSIPSCFQIAVLYSIGVEGHPLNRGQRATVYGRGLAVSLPFRTCIPLVQLDARKVLLRTAGGERGGEKYDVSIWQPPVSGSQMKPGHCTPMLGTPPREPSIFTTLLAASIIPHLSVLFSFSIYFSPFVFSSVLIIQSWLY